MNPKTRWALAIGVAGVALDQVTKAMARRLGPREQIDVIPDWLAFVHAKNPGAAFSMLADSEYRFAVFGVFTIVMIVALFYAWRAAEPEDRWTGIAIGLFGTGALGNAIDRVLQGHVTDMVKVYAGSGPVRDWAIATFGTNVYPIWNVADAAIVIAVPLYLLATVLKRDQPQVDVPPETSTLDPLSADRP